MLFQDRVLNLSGRWALGHQYCQQVIRPQGVFPWRAEKVALRTSSASWSIAVPPPGLEWLTQGTRKRLLYSGARHRFAKESQRFARISSGFPKFYRAVPNSSCNSGFFHRVWIAGGVLLAAIAIVRFPCPWVRRSNYMYAGQSQVPPRQFLLSWWENRPNITTSYCPPLGFSIFKVFEIMERL